MNQIGKIVLNFTSSWMPWVFSTSVVWLRPWPRCFGRWRLARLAPFNLLRCRKSQDRLAPKTPNFCFFFGTIICYVHHSGSISWYCFWAEKDMFFSSSGCWFFQFQTFRGLGLGVVGSSRLRTADGWYKSIQTREKRCWVLYVTFTTKECQANIVSFIFLTCSREKKHIPPPKKRYQFDGLFQAQLILLPGDLC